MTRHDDLRSTTLLLVCTLCCVFLGCNASNDIEFVDVADYDQSCEVDEDCVLIGVWTQCERCEEAISVHESEQSAVEAVDRAARMTCIETVDPEELGEVPICADPSMLLESVCDSGTCAVQFK